MSTAWVLCLSLSPAAFLLPRILLLFLLCLFVSLSAYLISHLLVRPLFVYVTRCLLVSSPPPVFSFPSLSTQFPICSSSVYPCRLLLSSPPLLPLCVLCLPLYPLLSFSVELCFLSLLSFLLVPFTSTPLFLILSLSPSCPLFVLLLLLFHLSYFTFFLAPPVSGCVILSSSSACYPSHPVNLQHNNLLVPRIRFHPFVSSIIPFQFFKV